MRKLVLWGHHFSEYVDMFDLEKDMTGKKILEFACGPTAVNDELSSKGHFIQSCDPWFSQDIAAMQQRFTQHLQQQIQHMETHPERFNFDKYGGMDTFIAKRQQGFQQFFKDYLNGYRQGRYQPLRDGHLPFSNSSFDIAVCSNFLFADVPEQGLSFQLTWIKELARVANDIRIYPLTDQQGHVSELLGPILLQLQQDGFQVVIQEVPFRLVPNSKAMLKLSAGRCELR